ncbi:alpha/beta hydrolase [Neptunomonas sp. XY-337]|uniref:alpha/beta fold hydrolase n=1 Tax=Neptunomonas sp. XY-337 TaxID=2561897 RepID=UPI0010AA0928|nr:alpha/beta hydrolase [Neptunomonas sp. XY-337]
MQAITEQLTQWSHEIETGELRGWMTPHCGNNGRPVIFFLHGNGLSSLTYWPFLEKFQDQYDLFLGAVAGHGDSDAPNPKQPPSWNKMAAQACEALQAHRASWAKDTPVIAMGHSFGGICITLINAQQPGIFDQLVLLDPVVFPKSTIAAVRLANILGLSHHIPHAKKALQRRNSWASRQEVHRSLKGRGVFKTWQDDALNCYIDHAVRPGSAGTWELRCPPWLEARIFSSSPKGLWSAIGKLPAHTQIVHATDTFPFVPKGVAKAERANPNIRVTQIEGGHCFMQEDPDKAHKLAKTLLAFPR